MYLKKMTIVVVVIISIALIIPGFYWYKTRYVALEDTVPSLIVGTSADFPPLVYIGEKTGIPEGFEIDLVHELARRIGKTMIIKNMPFTSILPQLDCGTLHIAAAGITPTEERAKKVSFTEPYITNNPLVVITSAKKPVVTSLEDLKGKTIIVNQGYTADLYLSQKPDIKLKRLQDATQSFMALNNNQGDAFVTAIQAVEDYFKTHKKEDYKFYTIPGTNDSTALAVCKNDQELLNSLNKALKEIKQDGTLVKLKAKWGVL